MMVSRAALDRGDTEYPCSHERCFSAAPCLPARKLNGIILLKGQYGLDD